ncbi:MAG: SIR2 family NAD-dependent protein deacylase [Candidatus Heimdallarchaeaceae archaeon]
MNDVEDISDIARLAKKAKKILFFTGAGISTPSGIPDFRSTNGIWQKFDPNEYATITAFKKNPEKVWKFFLEVFSIIKSAEPNEAHYAISNIQKILGEEKVFVATQNIDTLHQKADTKNVFEIHDLLFAKFVELSLSRKKQ